jgi:hypothetical protein
VLGIAEETATLWFVAVLLASFSTVAVLAAVAAEAVVGILRPGWLDSIGVFVGLVCDLGDDVGNLGTSGLSVGAVGIAALGAWCVFWCALGALWLRSALLALSKLGLLLIHISRNGHRLGPCARLAWLAAEGRANVGDEHVGQ